MRLRITIPCVLASALALPAGAAEVKGDRDYGEYLSSECTTCHQAGGEDRGIPSITGWPAEAFVMVMRSYKTKEREHPVMRMIAGRLSEEEIASLALYFAELE